jgi:hypothetical protein
MKGRVTGLDIGGADHLAPLVGFLVKPPPIIRGRAAHSEARRLPRFGGRKSNAVEEP